MNFRNFKRSTKAISPIFATLILIAIAVIAGVIVYMFTSGYLAGMAGSTGGVNDKLAVPAASAASVIVTNQGQSPCNATAAILKDSGGATVATVAPLTDSDALAITPGLTVEIDTGFTGLVTGQVYTVTVTTSGGGSFVSAPFTAP